MRPTLSMLAALFAVAGLLAAQLFLFTPGVTTYGEFRLLTLAAIPALTIIVSARWVDGGRRKD
jgi:hypothetical protein